MNALLLAAAEADPNEWSYVAAAYALVVGVILLYAIWTIVRGRKVGRQLPPEDRRWM
ncbi:heme exporter protein CcmD [Aquihabitans sp. G128]|uniref:heme exporter protein CcmD n=1 Tax=Aquihabitans sp. G128 TaxID=2849779 RepID=UPI001C248CB5|nr:heme exporter protein CcmD [Aquihabitans sp. G128]QXC60947.1 heme exporter protein CcmD [Aquihabitans sp. G128]